MIGDLVRGIVDAEKNNGKEADLLVTIINHHGQGNIVFVPKDAFEKLVSYVGIQQFL